ncbi:23S rRNA (adenine(1618)-N(6))-methyltransferase RlmF [Alginatibacterium sediminis]|uniref:Ribosomal RNA large subunit methyltransferase F n=1 Tax=Alginatibacterium sediminis TaxID=2164068 RepID=A0A420EDK2_9ALTE|nr:23S rRNA (adenine(1618)-N(6))-methyltransferase RlmF [Alginatibacterium sediminis]RKF18748.1 23S rRNA (adenine(1618)-N(6))-methyltransferase RlmF [Alginatibacterium sediminis]
MTHNKQPPNNSKTLLHPRSQHLERYDFERLVSFNSALQAYIKASPRGDLTIDFAQPKAVLELNRSLLACFYGVENWTISENNLCPPIPGRADYLHYLGDLLEHSYGSKAYQNKSIRALDVGVGANCVYPLLGVGQYAWSFVGSDIDPKSLVQAQANLDANPKFSKLIELRLQRKQQHIFKSIIQSDDYFDISLCNPPFHASAAEAKAGSERKSKNLSQSGLKPTTNSSALNFGGQSNELWCKGGELAFIRTMITESSDFQSNVLWFTSLVSKQDNLKAITEALVKAGVVEHRIVDMAQGNKVSRFVAWSFLPKAKHREWKRLFGYS